MDLLNHLRWFWSHGNDRLEVIVALLDSRCHGNDGVVRLPYARQPAQRPV